MERHAAAGASILRHELTGKYAFLTWRSMTPSFQLDVPESPAMKMAACIALTHHERWDGGGYPRGVKGEEIPIEGRIVALADAYDALITPRTYKPALPHEKAVEILAVESGKAFDPTVYAAFDKVADTFKRIGNMFAAEDPPTHLAETIQ